MSIDNPRKGDQVAVGFTGIYSHQGGPTGEGWHVVTVGTNGIAVPPLPAHVSIAVLKRAVQEPPELSVVEAPNGRAWVRARPSLLRYEGRPWKAVHDSGILTYYSWEEVLKMTNRGEDLTIHSFSRDKLGRF